MGRKSGLVLVESEMTQAGAAGAQGAMRMAAVAGARAAQLRGLMMIR
jgi:hypothetical protein